VAIQAPRNSRAGLGGETLAGSYVAAPTGARTRRPSSNDRRAIPCLNVAMIGLSPREMKPFGKEKSKEMRTKRITDSNPPQPGNKRAVHTIDPGQKLLTADFVEGGLRGDELGDDGFIFLGFEAAGAVDQFAA